MQVSRRGVLPVALVLLACHAQLGRAQDSTAIDLRGIAAFRTGDDDAWRSRYIDERDGGWNFIPVPGAWQGHGFPLFHGVAWYRMRFRIPAALRDDSLLLVMSGVDDADETYLNGGFIGRTGAFPPRARSEPHSLRVYPIPRALREEYNLLAVRVYDRADSGGITGSIVRIIRHRDLPSVLNQIVDEPFRRPPLFTTNGVMISAVDPVTRTILWSRPHLFSDISRGLETETILSSLSLTVDVGGRERSLGDCSLTRADYIDGTGAIEMTFAEGFRVVIFHPHATASRVLEVVVRMPARGSVTDPGVRFTFTRQYWAFRELRRETALERQTAFIFAYNSCCDDLARRDLDAFLSLPAVNGMDSWSIDREMRFWDSTRACMRYLPRELSSAEQAVYRQSTMLLLSGIVREAGSGQGQIVSGFQPPSRAVGIPRDHLRACASLAQAGFFADAEAGLRFASNAGTGSYTFFNYDGTERGVGYPHLITPWHWYGDGSEARPDHLDEVRLSLDGLSDYIAAVEALRDARHRAADASSGAFSDSAFVSQYWNDLSRRAADVLTFVRDTAGFIVGDAGPWETDNTGRINIHATIHAAAALRIAARYARMMHDGVKAFRYSRASEQSASALVSLVERARTRTSAKGLPVEEEAVFDPLLLDAVLLGVFPRGSAAATFALDMTERSFAIDDAPDMYAVRPDGDWSERQARPQLTLRLARAHLANGDTARAEALFSRITALALEGNGAIPELVDPVSKNWYGAIPALGAGAAEYILTAEAIATARIAK